MNVSSTAVVDKQPFYFPVRALPPSPRPCPAGSGARGKAGAAADRQPGAPGRPQVTLEPQTDVTPLNNTPTGASSYSNALYYTVRARRLPRFASPLPPFPPSPRRRNARPAS